MRFLGWNLTRASDDLPKLALEAFSRIEASPGDILVLTTPQRISKEMADNIREVLEARVKELGVKVLVIGDGMSLALLARKELDANV